MKGRTNYLCQHRFARLQEAQSAMPADERRWVERIADWAAATETGDRAEIDDLTGQRHVPVVDDEHRPVCVISVRDVVNFLVNAFPREVLNLPEPGTTPDRCLV